MANLGSSDQFPPYNDIPALPIHDKSIRKYDFELHRQLALIRRELKKRFQLLGTGGGGTTAGDESIIISGGAARANISKDAITSEALVAGNWVTVRDIAGIPTVRKADWTLGHAGECNGYVASAYALGAIARVFISGVNGHVAGMTVGDVWLAATGLGSSAPPPTVAGCINQRIGRALSATEVGIEWEPAILMAAPISVGAVPMVGWTRIAQVITTGSAPTITFSAIPQVFTNLKLIFTGRCTSAVIGEDLLRIKINGDATAANYTNFQYHQGLNGTGNAANIQAPSVDGALIGAIPGTLNNAQALSFVEMTIGLYAGIIFHKLVDCRYSSYFSNNATPLDSSNGCFVWKNAAAITDIVLKPATANFVDGSIATLYGLA